MQNTVNKYPHADIGLEIHVQMNTKTKLFSSAKKGHDLTPNSSVAPMDLGVPGVLPQLNREAIACATRIAMALGAEISPEIQFDRKHYNYLDLPSGYQITQFFRSFAYGGEVYLPNDKVIKIKSMHIETDAAKLKYTDNNTILIDYNRCGTPLLEIVTEHDMHSSEDTVVFVETIQRLIKSVRGSNCDMEKGEMRADVNISVRESKEAPLGIRTEIKNLNSCKNIRDAINYEIKKQQNYGRPAAARTVSFNTVTRETEYMRHKESAHDYCYTREYNIPTVVLDQAFLDQQKKLLPKLLPHEQIKKYQTVTSLKNAIWLVDHPQYDHIIDAIDRNHKTNAINVIINVINPYLDGKSMENFQINNFICAVQMLQEDKISVAIIKKKLIKQLFAQEDIKTYIENNNLCLVNDKTKLDKWLTDAINQDPRSWERYCNGETKLANLFKGYVMRLSEGKAHPILLENILRAKKQAIRTQS